MIAEKEAAERERLRIQAERWYQQDRAFAERRLKMLPYKVGDAVRKEGAPREFLGVVTAITITDDNQLTVQLDSGVISHPGNLRKYRKPAEPKIPTLREQVIAARVAVSAAAVAEQKAQSRLEDARERRLQAEATLDGLEEEAARQGISLVPVYNNPLQLPDDVYAVVLKRAEGVPFKHIAEGLGVKVQKAQALADKGFWVLIAPESTEALQRPEYAAVRAMVEKRLDRYA